MFQALGQIASRLLSDVKKSFARQQKEKSEKREVAPPAANYQPLKRVIITDGVGRTLFEEYAGHQGGQRGEEETGWVLLGVRQEDEALVLATLPAGAERDAGVGHVQFNSSGQVVGSRYVRQTDRRLTILGVVHTHPGSLRHPSDGDFRGDSKWVAQLRGGDGIFGIGTADARPGPTDAVAWQPQPHRQCLGDFCLSWYALVKAARAYR